MKKALALILALVMVLAMIPAAFAAGDELTEGVTVAAATEADKSGEYGEAYTDAGYKATFVYRDTTGKEIEYVNLDINAVFYSAYDVASFEAAGHPRSIELTAKTAYEYRKGMISAYNNAPGTYTNLYTMEKGENGIYTVSLPLPAQAYNYRYSVKYAGEDGTVRVLDPANPSPSNPVTGEDVAFSMFYVGTAENAPEAMRDFYPVEEAYRGTVTYTSITASNGEKQDIGIYLPYNYDASKTYKTVYASHGSTGDEVEWFSLGSLANIMDNLVKDGKIEDTIVVTMNNNNPFNNLANLVEVAKNLSSNLVPYIEANYSVSREAADRAVFGLSAGGSMATNLLQTIPEDYGYVGISSVGRSFPISAATADLNDIKDTTVAIYSGVLDFRYGATEKIYTETASLGGVCTFKAVDGAHDWTAWSEAIDDFLTNVVWNEYINITTDDIYTAKVDSDEKGDVTAKITTADGTPAFTDESSVATIDGNGSITIDAGKITGISFNGTSDLYFDGVKIGTYTVPELTVDSNLFGSAYTNGKSTLKLGFDIAVDYAEDSAATMKLDMRGLDNALIDSSNAAVILDEGDGYFPEEYTFLATEIGAFENGETTYALKKGDLEMDTQGYVTKDANSGREWSVFGGDGHGNYWYNLKVSGITYNGIPVGDQTFRLHIYIYGNSAGGSPRTIEAVKAESGTAQGSEVIWTHEDEPILCDYNQDNIFITWPVGTDASGITAEDVTITLKSEYGDTKTLEAGKDYTVFASAGETQIAMTYINLLFIPVYNTMTVNVKGEETTINVASVWAYEVQQGGGGVTVDGTVTVYSFYGLADVTPVANPATYTLRTTIDGENKYYAEDENGKGILAEAAEDAKVYDGNGASDRNLQVIENSIYVTTRRNATEEKTVDGESYTFTKVYSGGGMKNPSQCDESLLIALPGYAIPYGTRNWITNEKIAWAYGEGWTGLTVQPNQGRNGYRTTAGTYTQFTVDSEEAQWKIVGTPTSDDTYLDESGLLYVGADENGFFGVCAYIPGDQYRLATIAVTANAPASTIDVASAEATAGIDETVSIGVTYNSDTPASSVRTILSVDGLDITDVSSDFDFEYNPKTGAIVIWTTGEINKGDALCTLTVNLEGAEAGTYKVKARVIDNSDTEVNSFTLVGMPGYINISLAKGDINGDGSVDNRDLIMIARYLVDLVEFNEKQLEAADYNEDGKVDNKDLILIARAIVAA